ncbi:hypothetical protein GSI_14666 [Ganoderma sinense ZZ0214-1]|uniref:Uncharacterized protein n=1 Tax=Ganoderma sinense ZZ0214-1 TaxID=1077348 RepID=A0A2G8RPA8_9APHY|nr:hypothetical protein GSI_14666 [Ganoderma sinense ZZ0214-1]
MAAKPLLTQVPPSPQPHTGLARAVHSRPQVSRGRATRPPPITLTYAFVERGEGRPDETAPSKLSLQAVAPYGL